MIGREGGSIKSYVYDHDDDGSGSDGGMLANLETGTWSDSNIAATWMSDWLIHISFLIISYHHHHLVVG